MSDFYTSGFTLGILGGGQLGKMLLTETARLNVQTAVLDPSAEAPCAKIAHRFQTGNLKDFDTVYRFGKTVNLLTIEIEHVNVDALEQLENEGLDVRPSSKLIRTIQNKADQKEFYSRNGIPTARFTRFESLSEINPETLTYPCVYKSATEGYDGRGVKILKRPSDFLDLQNGPCIIEDFVSNAIEIAVLVARNPSGTTVSYPPVSMDFHPEANQVEFIYSPPDLPEKTIAHAIEVAEAVATAFELTGLMAIEMFLTESGEILVNESAPRPHNSGHLSIEGHYTSQFAQHLRAILDLPLGSTAIREPSVMVNLVGAPGYTGPPVYDGIEAVLSQPGVNVHIYGKAETRPFRKMGHVTVQAPTLAEARRKAIFVKETLKVIA